MLMSTNQTREAERALLAAAPRPSTTSHRGAPRLPGASENWGVKRPRIAHLFTVDVEEYFQVNAFERHVPPERWPEMESRIDRGVDLVLEALSRHDAFGTFFTLGWIAHRHPHIVRRIVDGGHEIASHGWWHRRLTTLTAAEFRADVRDSKRILEDVSGSPVRGFRAPSFSLVPGGEWAFDILIEEGYTYDSSLFPIRRPGYGYPGALARPHRILRDAGELVELPPATLEFLGLRVPAGGGGYFRQLPYWLSRRALAQSEARGEPATFYIHPWELDADQPRVQVGMLTRIRHYRGLSTAAKRLERILGEFRFTSVARGVLRVDTQQPGIQSSQRDSPALVGA